MFIGGFLLSGLVAVDTTLLQKPSHFSLFLAKVLNRDPQLDKAVELLTQSK